MKKEESSDAAREAITTEMISRMVENAPLRMVQDFMKLPGEVMAALIERLNLQMEK